LKGTGFSPYINPANHQSCKSSILQIINPAKSMRAIQLPEKLIPVKGTGFSLYVNSAISWWALAPEGMTVQLGELNQRFSTARYTPRP
jgi:hypothetical protein